MHPVGKVFMAIGILIAVGGGIMMAIGGSNVEDAGEWDVMEKSVWNGQTGTFNFEGDGDYLVMVRDTVRCDSFELTITNTTSGVSESYENEECTEDGTKPLGYEDDPSGWYNLGITWKVSEGTHEINASHQIYLVPFWEVAGEEIGEAVGGFLQGLGGTMLLCCGGVVTIFGLILGLLANNEQKVIIQGGAMPMGGQMIQGGQMTQTTMQQPVYQQVAQTPVQPQTTMQQPAEQSVWEQKSPENPF